jgi:hypothetical protein
MLRRVALVKTDVSEKLSATIITLMMESLSSSETSVLTRATQRNIPEDGILKDVSLVKSSGSGVENRNRPSGPVALTTRHPLPAKVGTDIAEKWWRRLGQCCSLAD